MDVKVFPGRFALSLKLLLAPGSAFHRFLDFCDWLWQTSRKTHEFALERLVDLLFEYLTASRGLAASDVQAALLADYRASGARGKPKSLPAALGTQPSPQAVSPSSTTANGATPMTITAV